jgi:hypothetical protein
MPERRREVRKERGVEHQGRESTRCPGGAPRTQCRTSSAPRRRDTYIALDDQAKEAIRNFARLLARCGHSPEDALRELKTAFREFPPDLARYGMGRETPTHDAANLMSQWYTNADSLNSRGRPIPLPLLGPAPSIEALARQVGSTVAVTELRDYLILARTIKPHGDRYIPFKRHVLHRPQTRTLSAHCLRIVAGLLRTSERNITVDRNARSVHEDRRLPWWFEMAADGDVPQHETIKTMRYLEPACLKLLEYADDTMLRRRAPASTRNRNVPLAMVVYMFEGLPEGQSRGTRHPQPAGASTTPTPAAHRSPRGPARKGIKAQRKPRTV